jgi:hypothetical protein
MKGPCTVHKYLMVLTSKLTQYDQKENLREMKRGGRGNIYRLGHLLEASQKVEDRVAKLKDRHDPEALSALKSAIAANFTHDDGIFGLAPVRNVIKQINSGKCSLVKK